MINEAIVEGYIAQRLGRPSTWNSRNSRLTQRHMRSAKKPQPVVKP